MELTESDEYLKQREDYDNTSNVIDKLEAWKSELESKVASDPKDVNSYGLISEIELAIVRLDLLAGTDVKSSKVKLNRLDDTADDYDYRVMCEWGYKEREKWTDAEEKGEKITIKACDYIINM